MQPTETKVPKLTFNVREVCESLGISGTTLWRLEKRNILKPLPGFGRHKLYSANAIRRLAETGVEVSATRP